MSLPSSQVSPLPQNVVPKRKHSHRVRSGDVPVTAPLASQSSYVVAPTAATFGVGVDPASCILPVPGGTVYQQLPAVSISYVVFPSLSLHPAGLNAHTLRKRVSYGDLTPSDVTAVTTYASEAPSDSGEGNPYVDDIAEEALDESASGSKDEREEGQVTPHASLPLPSPDIATAIRASPPSLGMPGPRLNVDFTRTLYLAPNDDVRLDPSIALSTSCRPGRSRKDLFLASSGTSVSAGDGMHAVSAVHAGAISQVSSPTSQCSKVKKVKPSRNAEILTVHTDLAGAVPSDGTSYLPVKTLVTSLSRVQSAHGVDAPESSIVPAVSSSASLSEQLDAFVGSACRDSSPEQDYAIEASPPMDADAPASSETSGGHSPDEPDDPSLHVMLLEIQEEQLHAFYLTLTCLGISAGLIRSVFRAMVPIGQTVANFDQPPYITIEDVASLFSRHSLQSVVAWLYFVGYGCYCSLSTMPHPLFSFDGKKMMYNSSTCVAMIAGVVIDCSIFKVGQQGGWSVPSPAIQKPSVPKSAPGTSTRAKTGWPKSPAKPPTLASRPQSQYYHCLGFEDEVPIFDGHFSKGRHFLFHPEDFDNISTMPQFTRDLDRFAMVAVGYTPAVWSPGGQPRVNLNVQFIVLLGQAPKPAALAKAGYDGRCMCSSSVFRMVAALDLPSVYMIGAVHQAVYRDSTLSKSNGLRSVVSVCLSIMDPVWCTLASSNVIPLNFPSRRSVPRGQVSSIYDMIALVLPSLTNPALSTLPAILTTFSYPFNTSCSLSMPPFVPSTMADGPLDYGAMAKALDAYDADITRNPSVLSVHGMTGRLGWQPERWIRIIDDPAVDGDAMFLCEYAMECEIDLSAAIVRLGLQNVIHGFRYLNWPVFTYNFFLHLLTCVESIVIEGRGARQGETFPPRIPCPYLLPPTVIELHLKNISLQGYSLEGMLLPDGSLQRLRIECIQEGALYIPDPMTAASRADIQESLGLHSFHGPYLLAPPAPTLRYIKLDLRTNTYGVLEENHVLHADLTGGFALLHQLFSTAMACAETDLFLDYGEQYPFQTSIGALEELDLHVGTQYYGDVSLIWPQVVSTLTTLTIQIPEHHTGGFVPYINLVSLDILSTLNVYANYRGISNTLKTICTWSSSCKSTASAVLLLELEVSHWTCIGLEDWVPTFHVREHLIGSPANGGTAFGGRFIFSLRDPIYLIHDPDYDHALSVVASLSGDNSQ
ncbi:hypothetical protein EV421DRAFT_1736442 [Armillaria borealis]|uniref:Uncharacterized protein n=1 Tax=Armillaria borealis TaxID=47425 RepID=A0AA39JI50_9AGAR|nr:hypothetical protein EV421DRAFT_1736442 [Armillaria borealis]